MVSDAPHEEGTSPQNSAVRELARLWVQSQPIISAYVTANVLDVHHAEDLVQEVAQIAAEKYSTFDRNRSFVSWALGIARNRVLKYYRSRARDRLVLSETALTKLEQALEQVGHEAEDRRAALKTCLEKIQGRRREVLELRYSQNAKVADIAQRFGMSSDGVFVMLHRIRTVLYGCIHRQLAKGAG
ncbi:MAG TPA: sigma-70 family RNA polymerase sigma factor [Pirellulales bacterium]|jgi:RNA polymerase sigma-70 factor (ECF subfamily)|nr:sigma-70 family RNA polymerase sigma factor [Pirellulales bacterium]